jgi:hypothetical protein
LTEQEWEAALDVVRERQAEERPRVNRFIGVQQAIVSGAESARLLTAFRSIDGGLFTDIPAWWWNTEKLENRFSRCQINPTDPFSSGFAGKGFCYVYVLRDSLSIFLSTLTPSAKQTTNVEVLCGKWLEASFLREETLSWSKAKFQEETAREFGPALGKRMFDRAWTAAVSKPGNEARRKAGAKVKLPR